MPEQEELLLIDRSNEQQTIIHIELLHYEQLCIMLFYDMIEQIYLDGLIDNK
jgi:hypothetical protein